VLKQISPRAVPGLPKPSPKKTVPSASIKAALEGEGRAFLPWDIYFRVFAICRTLWAQGDAVKRRAEISAEIT
jgi:hypothetical protein